MTENERIKWLNDNAQEIINEIFSVEREIKRVDLAECAICGWNKTARHCHHIIPISQGGIRAAINEIYLCPNCHAMAHAGLISKTTLYEMKRLNEL